MTVSHPHSTLLQSWLEVLCKMLPGVSHSVVLCGPSCEPPEGPPLQAVAQWPRQAATSPALLELALQGLHSQSVATRTTAENTLLVASPLHYGNSSLAMVALEFSAQANHKALILQLLEWGQHWLGLLLAEQGGDQQGQFFKVLQQALLIESLQGGLTAVATALAQQLGCQRLTVGLLENGHFAELGSSFSSNLNRNSNLLALIKQAMMVAVDQGDIVSADQSAGDHPVELAALLAKSEATSVTAIPLLDSRQQLFGAVLVESADQQPLSRPLPAALGDTIKLLGPLLHLKWLQQQPLWKKLWLALNQFKRQGLSRGRLLLTASAVVLLALFVLPADYRVTARAQLEGRVQRTVVAPFDGYVEQSLVRAGATVAKGALLARLDDDNLQLERQRWLNERDKFHKEYRKEFAALNHAETRILKAQMAQAEARLQLLDEKLKRVDIVAPIEGVVISGDLSRALGAPIEKGSVLFEVAPLDEYRLVLLIDERDIPFLEAGQQGRLTLTAQPGRELEFVVEEVATLFEQQDGVVRYRSEARLENAPESLRPGMGGVAKVSIGRRSLGWIVFHEMFDWLKLWLWKWLP